MQQFYKNVVDSKVFGYKIEFSQPTKWGFFAMKCTLKIRSLFLSSDLFVHFVAKKLHFKFISQLK